MNIDQFKARFENENACRCFFESVLWRNGRFCPHCHSDKSYRLSGKSVRAGLYECAQCKRNFTVTNHTPMHKFAKMLERHRCGILNHCDYPIQTGKQRWLREVGQESLLFK